MFQMLPVIQQGTELLLTVGLSPSKEFCFIYFKESPLNMVKNVFYFILKALFILKILKFLP